VGGRTRGRGSAAPGPVPPEHRTAPPAFVPGPPLPAVATLFRDRRFQRSRRGHGRSFEPARAITLASAGPSRHASWLRRALADRSARRPTLLGVRRVRVGRAGVRAPRRGGRSSRTGVPVINGTATYDQTIDHLTSLASRGCSQDLFVTLRRADPADPHGRFSGLIPPRPGIDSPPPRHASARRSTRHYMMALSGGTPRQGHDVVAAARTSIVKSGGLRAGTSRPPPEASGPEASPHHRRNRRQARDEAAGSSTRCQSDSFRSGSGHDGMAGCGSAASRTVAKKKESG
jgi:hypothetical protein